MEKKLKNKVVFAIASLLVALFLVIPPIHEGLHTMACELQGGTTCSITFDYHICNTATFGESEIEKWYSFPSFVAMFFVGFAIKSTLEVFESGKKQ